MNPLPSWPAAQTLLQRFYRILLYCSCCLPHLTLFQHIPKDNEMVVFSARNITPSVTSIPVRNFRVLAKSGTPRPCLKQFRTGSLAEALFSLNSRNTRSGHESRILWML